MTSLLHKLTVICALEDCSTVKNILELITQARTHLICDHAGQTGTPIQMQYIICQAGKIWNAGLPSNMSKSSRSGQVLKNTLEKKNDEGIREDTSETSMRSRRML